MFTASDRRKVTNSYVITALPMRRRAKLLVRRMTSISFRLIGVSRRKTAMSRFDFGNSEQLGACHQIGGVKGGRANSQTDMVVIRLERDHSSAIEKIFGFAHREHTFPGDYGQ